MPRGEKKLLALSVRAGEDILRLLTYSVADDQKARYRMPSALPPLVTACKTGGMEVHLTPDQETLLNELATTTGRGTDDLVQEAVDRLLAYNRWFSEQVQIGLEQADRGELIEDDEVRARIERMFPR